MCANEALAINFILQKIESAAHVVFQSVLSLFNSDFLINTFRVELLHSFSSFCSAEFPLALPEISLGGARNFSLQEKDCEDTRGPTCLTWGVLLGPWKQLCNVSFFVLFGHTQTHTHTINKSFFLTYQVFAHILRLHPACEVTEGAMELVHHYFNLRQDGLKFWLLCNNSNNSKNRLNSLNYSHFNVF